MKRVVFLFKSRQVAHYCLSGTHTIAKACSIALLVELATK